ncbi:MAG TPA: alpha-amylase family glycosyl hydrolase [Acidimicrobiia bacterium]
MTRFPRLGAVVDGDDVTHTVWAPDAKLVELVTQEGARALTRSGDGTWTVTLTGAHDDAYRFRIDATRTLPDPMSRAQPEGVLGPSAVVDPTRFVWTDQQWQGVALADLVLYELHVGTFTDAGTFTATVDRFPELVELGVTAIELMPVATFPGRFGWGYDGLYTSAPHPAYGGPEDLARLVDRAHALGLGVVLDVVYNHLGPGADALTAFAPYTDAAHDTFWGPAVAFGRRGVREWAIQNAEQWVRDYHVDGLRLDAVHAIVDDSQPHIVSELGDRVRGERDSTLVIAEMETGDLRPIHEWHCDAQWGDDLHHAVHVLLTGEHDGYYAGYGTVAQVAQEFEGRDATRLVVCGQNHDQVGNRAFGERLRGRQLRLAAFCSILAPGVPLLFMGEEYDESHPFLFFADHIDPEIARATREGRRREFASFASFAHAEVPDPGALDTFAQSKLDPAAGDPGHREYYRHLLELRRALPAGPVRTVVDEDARFLRVWRGDVQLLANFSDVEQHGVGPWEGRVR